MEIRCPFTAGLVIRSAALSRAGTKLAYSKGRTVGNLWRIPILADRPATWADAEQLTFDQALIDSVNVSPDGKRLAFNSDRTGNEDLWIMPVEGGEMQQLTTHPLQDSSPVWSPDGQEEVAFYSYRSGNRDIWVMPVSGGAARQVTRDEAQDRLPAWSPDGRELVFQSSREGNNDIWVIPAEGGDPRRLTQHPEVDAAPKWSPDGKWLVFQSNRTGQYHLWRISREDGEPEQLSERVGRDPRWSLDGKRIYCNSSPWPVVTSVSECSIVSSLERSAKRWKRGQHFVGEHVKKIVAAQVEGGVTRGNNVAKRCCI